MRLTKDKSEAYYRVPLLKNDGAFVTGNCFSYIKLINISVFTMLLTLLIVPQMYGQQIFTGSDGVEVTITDKSRIISIGSAVTETIFALGAEENLIAVDESSVYPDGAASLPKVSFTRNLSAEGVLSLSPALILSSGAAGPETAVRQIRSTGTPMLLLPADETVDAAFKRVEMLGHILNRENEAAALIEEMKKELAVAESYRNRMDQKPKVLFIYARGPNNLTVAGRNTSAKTMIELAGGVNAFDDFSGYRPLTAEAVVSANPDVILMMKSGVDSIGGDSGVLRAPGVSLTTAGQEQRIYSMDGIYLLGFGPRLGKAVLDLMQLIYPGLEVAEI
jgi:iron complex transport system substrate-binding protein